MKITRFDGTAEEFKAVAHIFETGEDSSKTPIIPEVEPVEAIRYVFERRDISDGQKAVFQALSGDPITYKKLLIRTDRESSQMAGILGALGRRINNTPEIHAAGLPGNVYAIILYEKRGGETYMSLKPVAKDILTDMGVIE